ncbi:TIGR03668 family PPOX class F420-dependent oxidoreductase [Baekduia sp. Peel2402]|uniref:TIGR03668 family PPOX class F420-dependent oxidoreductase n=1 Tax=Baekduia sp. Peel2402 TaxID=3458296 RepID=UPI00403EF15F
MTDERAWELLGGARVARFATTAPRVVPVTFAVVGRSIVHAVDHKPKATRALARVEDLRRDPRASVLVDHYGDADWSALWWVRADGAARVLEAAEATAELDALVAKYPQYAERRPEGPVIALDVERIVSWSAAG